MKKRTLWIILLIAAICFSSVGGTMAYLTSQAEKSNVFDGSTLTCTNTDTGAVTNTGDVTAYVRVAITYNYTNTDAGNWTGGSETVNGRLIHANSPKDTDGTYPSGVKYTKDYAVTYNTSDWIVGADCYLYYKYPLAAGATTTTPAINSLTVNRPTFTGSVQGTSRVFHFTVDVCGEVIQCEDASKIASGYVPAVVRAWGVTLENNTPGDNVTVRPPLNFNSQDDTNTTDLGLTMSTSTLYTMASCPSSPIKSFEATLRVSSEEMSGKSGISVLANYQGATTPYVNMEIAAAGYPKLYFRNTSGTAKEYKFTDVNIIDGQWHHVAITINTSNRKVYCYVDGDEKQVLDYDADFGLMTPTTPLRLGGDYRSGNTQNNTGCIRTVALYSDTRSASEVRHDQYYFDVGSYNNHNLLGYYMLNNNGSAPGTISDLSTNGNHITKS